MDLASIPLFRTIALPEQAIGTGTEPAPIPLMHMRTGRPPLPRDNWVTGLATFAEAHRVQLDLTARYITALGLGTDGYYVASPDSGLCKRVNESS